MSIFYSVIIGVTVGIIIYGLYKIKPIKYNFVFLKFMELYFKLFNKIHSKKAGDNIKIVNNKCVVTIKIQDVETDVVINPYIIKGSISSIKAISLQKNVETLINVVIIKKLGNTFIIGLPISLQQGQTITLKYVKNGNLELCSFTGYNQ